MSAATVRAAAQALCPCVAGTGCSYLAVEGSWFHVIPAGDKVPLFRNEYLRQVNGSIPAAYSHGADAAEEDREGDPTQPPSSMSMGQGSLPLPHLVSGVYS